MTGNWSSAGGNAAGDRVSSAPLLLDDATGSKSGSGESGTGGTGLDGRKSGSQGDDGGSDASQGGSADPKKDKDKDTDGDGNPDDETGEAGQHDSDTGQEESKRESALGNGRECPSVPKDPAERKRFEEALRSLPEGKPVRYGDVTFTKLTPEQADSKNESDRWAARIGNGLVTLVVGLPFSYFALGLSAAKSLAVSAIGSLASASMSPSNKGDTLRGGDVICEGTRYVEKFAGNGADLGHSESYTVTYIIGDGPVHTQGGSGDGW